MVVDSTFATPLRQQPLAHGAAIVVHSATKFIGGHSDLLLGLCVTADDDVHERLLQARTFQGATPGALEAFLALRGLRTLPIRLASRGSTQGLTGCGALHLSLPTGGDAYGMTRNDVAVDCLSTTDPFRS